MLRGTLVMLVMLSAAPEPARASPIALEITRWTTSELEQGDDIDRRHYEMRWQGDDARVAYAHEPVLIRTGSPAHNGYFHRLDIDWRASIDSIRIEIGAGLHGSSNMFKQGEFHDDALVIDGKIVRQLDEFALGLSGDYRFGGFHLYPVVEAEIDATIGQWRLRLPTRLEWTSPATGWRITIERYGQKWAALDADRTVESAMYLDEWRASLDYEFVQSPRLRIGVGASFDTTIRYLDKTAGPVERSLDPGLFLQVRLAL